MICFIGIDPGLSGALALITDKAEFKDLIDIPIMAKSKGTGRVKNCVNAKGVYDIINRWKLIHKKEEFVVYMENVSSRPGDGAAGAFSFGDTFGTLKAVCACSGLNLNLVTPAAWKGYYKLPSADKEVARAFAISQFPSASEYLQRKKDHDRAEALLIALYGLRNL